MKMNENHKVKGFFSGDVFSCPKCKAKLRCNYTITNVNIAEEELGISGGYALMVTDVIEQYLWMDGWINFR